MVKFMIYLLETGICLSLLYLAYWLFLRKETCFSYNRAYLVCSIALALLVPWVHMNVLVPRGSTMERPVREIMKFRDSYEEMIRYINADFGREPGTGQAFLERGFEDTDMDNYGIDPSRERHGTGLRNRFPVSRILLIIYITGVFYFSARFLYLVIRLFFLVKHNRETRYEGFRMVEIEEQISPFSFFRFLFINSCSFSGEDLDYILEHEKVHIRQRHSLDHLIAHGLAVFQWFNPFAWQVRKALKSTHEFIADRQVLHRGCERSDYQALLLRQVIGYHSVELVNNFNLKPIKKRIAMMNKNRPGLLTMLKAMVVVPVTMIIFLFFSDFVIPDTLLTGLWVKQGEDSFSNTLFIKQNIFSFEEGNTVREYFLNTDHDALVLSEREGDKGIRLPYEIHGDELVIWWNDAQSSRYLKSGSENTTDHYLASQEIEVELPYISRYRLLDEDQVFRICIGNSPEGCELMTLNGEPVTPGSFPKQVQKERDKVSKLDQESMTALFLIDIHVPMKRVAAVREELRKIDALHIAEGGYPHGPLNLSPLLYHSVALPRLLPPAGVKVLEKNEVEKQGVPIHVIDLSSRNTTPRQVDEGLRRFLEGLEDSRYIISLEYDGEIPYGQYVETVDMIFNMVYSFRESLAEKSYGLSYDALGPELQKEMRKAYPMALSESMK